MWKPLEYSAAYLAIIAAAEVVLVMLLLGLPASPAPAVVGLVTFAVYTNDRLVDLDADAVSNPRRTAFVRRHRRKLSALAALSYGLAVSLSVFGGPVGFALAITPGFVWVLYAVDWIPGISASVKRLKEILLVNSVLVAGAWSLTVVFLPIAFAGAAITPSVWVVFLYFFAGAFVSTEIANVGDIAADSRNGISTLPTAFGVSLTRRLLYLVLLLTAGVLGYATAVGYLTTSLAAVLVIGLGCLALTVASLGRTVGDGLLTIAAEAARVPVLLLVLFSGLA